jgi:hypothetical protein
MTATAIKAMSGRIITPGIIFPGVIRGKSEPQI